MRKIKLIAYVNSFRQTSPEGHIEPTVETKEIDENTTIMELLEWRNENLYKLNNTDFNVIHINELK